MKGDMIILYKDIQNGLYYGAAELLHKRCAKAVVKEVWLMQITRTKKALIAVIALVLVGIFVAVAAVYLPGAENSQPFKDNTVADTGSGESTLATASASASAPSEDGTVPDGYTASGTGTTDISAIRNNPGGNYQLTGNMTVDSIDTSTVFTGTLDGCGNTIEIKASGQNFGEQGGGLFLGLNGATIKNVKIVVTLFSYGNVNTGEDRKVGIVAGYMTGGTTIDNVKVELNYDPTAYSSGNDMVSNNTYYTDTTSQNNKKYYTYFGGIVGTSEADTNTIKNTTVINASTGGAGVSVCVRNGKGTIGSPTSYVAMGLFVGTVLNSGTLNLTNIRVNFKDDTENNAQPKMSAIHYDTSSGTRVNYSGMIFGWAQSNTTVNVNGIIYDYSAKFENIDLVNTNFATNKFGAMYGYSQGTITVKDLYSSASTDDDNGWYDGDNDTIKGVIRTNGIVMGFDDTNENNVIITSTFNNPTSSDLVASVTIAGTSTNVLTALAVGDGEALDGETAYVSVSKSGYTHNANSSEQGITFGSANKGTMNLGGASFTENRDEGYYSTREYDGTAEANRSISLSTGKTIENVYVDNSGLGKNAGTHNLAYTADALGTAYKLVSYNGVNYIVGDDGYVYSPDNITINEQQSVIDVTKTQIVEITQRAITLGNLSGNVTYGDTLDVVQTNNIPEATSGSFVSGEYIESCTIDGYIQFAVNAGEQATFSYTGAVIKDADGNDVTANYNITFAEGKAAVKQKTVAGTISVADLVYDGSEKVAEFTATEGMGLFNDDAVEITYSGDRQNVTETGFAATATVPKYDDSNSNYTFESGASISETFKITPYEVAITVNDEATTEYEYSGVVPNSVLLTLFNAPEGLAGETLFLNFAAFINDEEATVNYVGTYTVRATLAESYVGEDEEIVSQANYTAASCDATITIKAKEINVSLSDVENSKTYDGAVVGDDYLQTMFVVDGEVAEGHVAELEITVAEGEIKNAGVYNISVALPSHYDIMYAISATSTTQTTYTVGQVVIDGEISAPEDSVYDGSEKFATFEITGEGQMVGDDEIIITYATQGGQGVTQVVSAGTYTVSAALPAYEAGKSNYQWANEEIATKDIVISKAPVTITANSATAEKQFDGVAFDDYASLFTAPKAVDGITDLVLSFSVGGAAENILNAGVYTVTATLENNAINANYEASEAVVTYTVTPVTVELVWSANDYTYDGSVQTVSATYNDINAGPVALAVSFGEGVEFRNAGEYTATASFAEGDNEYGNYVLPEIVTNTYNIKKADSVIDTENVVKTYTYTGALQTVESGATLNHGEAELVYSNNTFTTVAEGNGKEVVISVADTANYNGASTTVQITVNKATPEVTATVEPTEGLFTSSEMPAIGTDCAVEGTIAWDAEQTLTEGTNDYTWTFIPNDTANYNTVTGKVQLTVSAVALDRIEVKTQPSKVTYEYGDKFDKSGMIVEAVYNDGSRVAVEEYTYADAYLTTLGANQITIAYDGKETTVEVKVEAKAFEMAYSDLTVVAGTADFDIASITASIADTDGSNVTVAGQPYPYTVSVAYTDGAYSSADPVDTTYPLTVTLVVDGLDAQYYVGTYEATLRVIATSMEGSWTSESVTAEYDGASHAAEFNKTVGGEFEIQYAVKGIDVWTTDVPVNAGEYVAKVVSLNAGYSSDRLPTATVTINKKSVEIYAVSGTVSADYNGTAFADYASLFNAPSGVNDEGALELAFTVTKDGEPAEILGAGTYTVTATLANVDGNYTAAACEVTYTVAPAEITVKWTGSSSVVYSGKAYEPTFEATGLVGNDKISLTYEASEGALTDGKARNAGSYTAIVSLSSDNYVFAAETSTTFDFTVEKVKVSYIALLDGNTKYVEYGGEYTPSVDDFYTTSVANSELFEFYIRWSLEFDLSGIATANAGKKYEAAVEGVVRYAGGEDIAEADYCNFELTGYIADIVVYVEVIAKKINVTATDASATYDGEKVSVDKLLAMFGLVGIDANVTVDGEAYDFADIKNVGSYNVVVASANGNYEFVGDTDATFTVNAADMTSVTVTGYSGEYDKAAHGAVVNASATTVDGSEVTFTYATSEDGVYGDAPEYTDAGTYTVYYKAVAANHNEATGSFTVTIEKADYDISGVKFEDTTLVYNGSVQSISATGLPEGLTATYSEGIKDVGSVVITATLANNDDNYNDPVSTMQATLTISPKSLTVSGTFTAKDREYDGSPYVDLVGKNYALNGIVGSDEVTLLSYRGVMEDKNVGDNKTVNVIVQIAGADSKNYEVVQPASVTVNITPAELAVTWSDTLEFDYNGSEQAPTASVPTGVLGEIVEITVSGAQTDAGTYTATATTDNGNYTLTNATVEFTINKIASVIDVSGVVKDYVYNGTLQTINSGATLNHSEAELTYGNNTFTTVAEGNGMEVTVSVAESTNYLEASATFTITVTAKQITVVWGELTIEYDGTAKVPTATADTGIEGETVTIVVSGAAIEPGTYTATATTDNTNYTLDNTTVEFEIVRTAVAAQFTVGYGEITVTVDGNDEVEYSVDGGEWSALPEGGKISVELAASWTIKLRYAGETAESQHVVYTTANNVLIYLENNLKDDALLNKDVIATSKSWIETAVGDKTEANAKIAEAESAYNAAKEELAGSVENAFKATANMTTRTVAVTVALGAAVTGLGLAAGIIAIRRKGGKKNED